MRELMSLCFMLMSWLLPAESGPRRVVIPAPSLTKGDMATGEIAEAPWRELFVLLPEGYEGSKKRYPVLYFFDGFGDDPARLVEEMAALRGKGKTPEAFILVSVDGRNSLMGSFLVNSRVTGNWEDHVLKDVLGYVDSHYRTRREASGRILAGYSMGGFAALNLGMKHPDVFSASFAFAPGAFDANGLRDAYESWDDGIRTAYGSAFAPGMPFLQKSDSADSPVYRALEAGFGDLERKVRAYAKGARRGGPQFKGRLKAIRILYGDRDEYAWIPRGSRELSRQLRHAGIAHDCFEIPGLNHQWSLELFQQWLFPWASDLFGQRPTAEKRGCHERVRTSSMILRRSVVE